MRKTLTWLFLFFTCLTQAQQTPLTGEEIIKNTYENRDINATYQIKLQPGFSVSGNFVAKIVRPSDFDRVCSTPQSDSTRFKSLPWFDNNPYLDNLLDSIGYPFTSCPTCRVEEGAGIKYRIPVKFWVYRRSNGTGGPTENDLRRAMLFINQQYRDNGTGIRFYQKCVITQINDDSKLTLSDRESLAVSSFLGGRYDLGAINIHLVENVKNGGNFYGLFPNSIFIQWTDIAATGTPDEFSTFSHEIGHFLGLDHTHQSSTWDWWLGLRNCFKEPIDRNRTWAGVSFCGPRNRKKCESTGDALCDTPADPDLDDLTLNSCQFPASDTRIDDYGDRYAAPPFGSRSPDGTNIMSYATRSCRTSFTRQQIGVMYHTIKRSVKEAFNNRNGWSSANAVFDSFEPNNTLNSSAQMNVNQTEPLNFHWQYYRTDNITDKYEACDVDWVNFTLSSSSVMVIKTSAVSGKPQPNTRLTLFNASGAQIAQNDNASGSTVFSLITTGALAAGQYFVRVENLSTYPSNESKGHYNLGIYQCFDQQNTTVSVTQNCPSATVRVNNPPTGSTYNWVVSSGLTIGSGQGSSQITVNSSSGSNITGTAQVTVTVNGCSATLPAVNVSAGGGGTGTSISVSTQTQPGSGCGYANHTATAQLLTGISSSEYLWYEDLSGTPGAYLGSGLTLNLSLTPSNCSSPRFYMLIVRCTIRYRGYAYNPYCNCTMNLALYPNPSASDITVEVLDEPTDSAQDKARHDKPAAVELFTQLGHKVKDQKIQAKERKVTFSVKDLNEGLYILRFTQDNVVVQRLVEVRKQ